MAKKPLFTYTTKVDPAKTISEIQSELIEHGATSILLDYDEEIIVSLSFKINTSRGNVGIKLPCNHKPILAVLKKQKEENRKKRKKKSIKATNEQAYRVAWRIILYWVKAQMAILDAEMVTIEQIFLPYILNIDGQTLYEKLRDNKFQITNGGKNGL